MNEEEAKKKWCPMVRISIGDSACTNRGDIDKVASIACIASKCMLWRWNPPTVIAVPEGVEEHRTASGYCGLGGRPCVSVLY